ncbi:MAG: hypothetical protein HGA63_00700 [Syntrophobacteraceae bacterium]|nr:hypothetical protein [Syntrophobacteraceae bacterium]
MGSVPYKEQVVELVSGKMEEVSVILDTSMENLNRFVEELKAFLRVDVSLSNLEFTVPNLNLGIASVPSPPSAPTVNTDIPLQYPETVQLTDINIDLPPVPDVDATPPNIPERQIPDITISNFEGQLPIINTDIPIPTRPSITFPDAPTITKPSIRPFEGFTVPQIDGEIPEFLLNEIGVAYNHSEGVYSS